ncbi:hypothetical protein K443DRAFT_338879 [Laccaria amethystina LaAM-08-1]|uniref:Uncharacterized protein n=1 Tax=Laccaria amethystina LaAM-08-1 TaxID=1095629 RepID=A0A0C9XG55_9AGAR|nr:hypothetical protein K443DRAFT_338879 [Laccaria amethystina LaAM-08-1]
MCSPSSNTRTLWPSKIVFSGQLHNNAHVGWKKAPNNKYRNMRMLCAMWSWAALFAGVAYRIVQAGAGTIPCHSHPRLFQPLYISQVHILPSVR